MKEDKIDINHPGQNILVIIVISIALTFLTTSAPYSPSGNHGNIIFLVTPFLIGILTIICYLIYRIFSHSFNWIVTLLGLAFNILMSTYLYIST